MVEPASNLFRILRGEGLFTLQYALHSTENCYSTGRSRFDLLDSAKEFLQNIMLTQQEIKAIYFYLNQRHVFKGTCDGKGIH